MKLRWLYRVLVVKTDVLIHCFTQVRQCAFCLLMLLLSFSLHAQKVGVVLSGGGAKGLYHVGILKALEENGIPVDYISGTSMGSIVAGLYASGYSPKEIEAIFRTDDVSHWLTGKIEDRYLYYYKKMDPRPSIINLDVDLDRYIPKEGLFPSKADRKKRISVTLNKPNTTQPASSTLPSSLISSVQIDLAFLDLLSGAGALCKNDFDSLFVPFRCVAVDISSRKEKVWSQGDLAMAIRSSMAIPLIFSPVVVDSMILYDGGLMNNFPWREMEQEFHPDVIIGGKCLSGVPDVKTISGQVEMLITSKTDYNLPDSLGVLISRDIDVGMLDYKKADQIIAQGYNDALISMPSIKERIARRISVDSIAARRLKFKSKMPVLVFNKFTLEGLNPEQKQFYLSQIRSDLPKDTVLSFEEFKTNYFKVLSGNNITGGFPIAQYNDTTGYFGLALKLYNKPGLKVLMGLNISSTSVNQGYVGLQYNTTGVNNSLYQLDGYIGSYHSGINLSARYDYHKKRAFYLSADFGYNFFDYARGNSQRIAYKNTDLGHSRLNDMFVAGLIGMPLGISSKFELRLALGNDVYGYYRKDIPLTGTDNRPDKSSLSFMELGTSIKRNSLNYSMYPTRGLFQKIHLFGMLNLERYVPGSVSVIAGLGNQRISALVGGVSYKREDYINLSRHFNLGYMLEGMYTNMPNYTNQTFRHMAMPGFEPTPHSQTIFIPEFHNASYVAAGLIPIVEVNEKLYAKVEGYIYKANLKQWVRPQDQFRYIVSSSLVYQSPIGPVSFNYSHYAVSGIKRDYFTFNIGYLLFNKKGIQY